MAISQNTRLGRYEIRSQLGAGGMGEVYLALDAQLDRTVALKILPSDVALNGERMRRFIQEAKAAAALSHPNIAHIYEVGESDGTHFIAMEYVDGETLRAEIHRKKAPLDKLLKYLAQVAEGLAKAHAAGVVHRDLKPDNIMITRDGYAKILDFGLAKLIEPQRGFDSDGELGEVGTVIMAQHSTPGLIMGTVGYMSPEQAQGRAKDIDHRSDIFSFGCILYEAATRRRAFEGKDVLDSLHMIVHAQTPQIKDANAAAPAELQRIVRRCLAKEPDKRYQSIKEVAIELDELRQEFQNTVELDYSGQPQSSILESVSSQQQVKINSGPYHSAINATQTEVTHSTSSAEYVVSKIKRHQRGVGVIALLLAAAGIVFALYRFGWQDKPATSSAPFQSMTITHLTSNGRATQAVISPDGKQVVYVIDDGGQESLWLRQVAAGASDVQLTAPENAVFNSLTISNDGNFLYYVSRGESERDQKRALYKMPFPSGTSRKVVERLGPFCLSPDGKQVAFVRERQLMIANTDDTEERMIATRYITGVAWSPDGKRIAAVAVNSDSAGRFQNVIEIPIEGGTERPLTSKRWSDIRQLAWLADGSGLVMTATEQVADYRTQQVWHLSYASGEARKITNTLSNYEGISLSTEGSILVTVQEDQSANIWIVPNGASRATQITSVTGRGEGSKGVAWMPDGKIVYHSMAGGREGICTMETDGKKFKQLTTVETEDSSPSVSPDGRYIVFLSRRAGTQNVWRMDLDGGNPKRLTTVMGSHARPTRDNQVIYQTGGSSVVLMKRSMDEGEPVKIGEGMRWAEISPDGTLIACSYERPGRAAKLAIFRIEGGSPIKEFDAQLAQPAKIRWTPNGRAVTYVASQNGTSDIWSQPIDGGEPKKLTDLKADRIFSFDWSHDNKLVISHGTLVSDVVLIRNVR